MRALKVALIYKSRSGVIERDRRAMGWWSYPVPGFEWDFFPAVDRVFLPDYRGYDLVFHEDTAKTSAFVREGNCPPLVYLSIDSTLSELHHHARLDLAKQADLVLLDHDDPDRFKVTGKPIRRLNYCVNDHVFQPTAKSLDVAFHCGSGESRGFPGGKERNEIRRELGGICASHKYSYKSGAVGLDEYAANMGAVRVVVNWPRTVLNRPHRVFDAMACGAALLTGVIPNVDGDYVQRDIHYRTFEGVDDLAAQLDHYLDTDEWKEVADVGYKLIMARHTWSIRAEQLREIIREELGL